jgi:F0F1-type ATP synthase assembly protein I
VNDERRRGGGVALIGTIGGYVAACILGGLVVGWLADKLVNTSPLFLISGVVAGFVLSFYVTYRVAMREVGN